MKSLHERLTVTKPKQEAKLAKAFENGGCLQYQAAFLNEVYRPTAVDFPALQCVVTESFFSCYNMLGSGFSNLMVVIPLDQIVNFYRTNINSENKYDYDYFYLALELADGSKRITASMPRNAKTFMEIYSGLIACLRDRTRNRNPEVQ